MTHASPSLPAAKSSIEKTLQLEATALQQCLHRFQADSKPWETALSLMNETLDRAGKIVITGVGKSGKIAQKIAATFSSTGSHATFLHPTEALHGDLGFVRPGDCVLAISYTGNTEELIRLLPWLEQRKIPYIALTGNLESLLSKQAVVTLDGSVEREACPHHLAPTTSTTLALAIGDALAVGLMTLRNFDANSFALNHPGGSLGRKLTWRVEAVMKKGDELAIVSPETTMEQVIVVSSQKKLGAAAVVEPSGKLLGIITDGDIRRALAHREKIFTMKASEVMTANPVTIQGESLAQTALQVMENRPSQISVLPVVDANGKIQGLVRLHDLLHSF